MAQTVSNDALWEKLSEIDKKIDMCMTKQNAPTSSLKDITSEIRANKDEILKDLRKYIQALGTHCDIYFKANLKNIEQLDVNTQEVYKVLACVWSEMRESEGQKNDEKSYFRFKFFKVKKTSLLITVLGILIFILTVFCMKQQNDYSLLTGEYYRQGFVIKEAQIKMDSLNVNKTIR